MSSTVQIPTFQQPLNIQNVKSWFTLKNVKKVIIIGLKIIVIGALAFYQPPLFAISFAAGFIIKCIFKKECQKASQKIQAAIAKRPWLFGIVIVTGTILCPEWLLVGPSLLAGFYAGVQLAKLCQKKT